MNTTNNAGFWLIEAGEYVLGTLRGTERDIFEKVLINDTQAEYWVDYWEKNLEPLELKLQQSEAHLLAESGSVSPIPDHVWEQLIVAIDSQQEDAKNNIAANELTPEIYSKFHSRRSEVKEQQAILVPDAIRVNRWRTLSFIMLAATLGMGALLVQNYAPQTDKSEQITNVNEDRFSPETPSYNVVSILRDESGNNLWAILAETGGGRIQAVALPTAQPSSERSHQLWVVLPDDGGVQSIGVLPYGDGRVQVFELTQEDQRANLELGTAFAVSLEPAGGTNEPAPTGPVISSQGYTRLIIESD